MHTMRTRPMPGPLAESTRRQEPAARGYRPKPASWAERAAWAALRALATLSHRRRPYGEQELFVAFVAGLVLATCVVLPFLPR